MGLLDTFMGRPANWKATSQIIEDRFLVYRQSGVFDGRPSDEADLIMDLAFKHCRHLATGNFHPYVLATATMTHAVMGTKPSKRNLYAIALAQLAEFCEKNDRHLSSAEAKIVAAAGIVLEKHLATPSPWLIGFEEALNSGRAPVNASPSHKAPAASANPAKPPPPLETSLDRKRAMAELINRMR